jgi:hypothetical protein
MQLQDFIGMVSKAVFVMSIICKVCSGYRSLASRPYHRGVVSMSATNGVIVGGGRIGSFLYESNGNTFIEVNGYHCVATKRSFYEVTS